MLVKKQINATTLNVYTTKWQASQIQNKQKKPLTTQFWHKSVSTKKKSHQPGGTASPLPATPTRNRTNAKIKPSAKIALYRNQISTLLGVSPLKIPWRSIALTCNGHTNHTLRQSPKIYIKFTVAVGINSRTDICSRPLQNHPTPPPTWRDRPFKNQP